LRGGPTRKSHFSLIAAFLIASSSAVNEDFSGGEEHPASNNRIDKYRIRFSQEGVAYVTQKGFLAGNFESRFVH